MMKSIFFVISLVLVQLTSCPQKVSMKAHAFYSVYNRGTLLVDDQGKPVQSATDTIRFIFIEVPVDTRVSVDTVVYGNRYFIPGVHPSENEVRVGKGMSDGQEIIIRAKSDKKLLKVEMLSGPEFYYAASSGLIRIIGRSEGVLFFLNVDREVEVRGELRN